MAEYVRVFWSVDIDDSRAVVLRVVSDTDETLTGFDRETGIKHIIDKRAIRRLMSVKRASQEALL